MRSSLVSSSMGTGRRLRMEILEISGLARSATRAAEPTRPVAPVRMMCMVEFEDDILIMDVLEKKEFDRLWTDNEGYHCYLY